MTVASKENRDHTRINLKRKIFITLSSGEMVEAVMVNISNGGVGIVYANSSIIGTKLKILFSVPSRESPIPVSSTVTVVHIHISNDQFHIGLEFDDMRIIDKEVISKYIEQRLTQMNKSQQIFTFGKL